ncbi:MULTISPECIES: NADH-quinone oxidoreductase subunit NuoN [Thalassobaculum]|uniref:NADH-quinone oxidoreductase subunit N n=1 Tax=Thalassobaculum litoreum DSM 18839 TaxID=1123362 RepID=A0A8G2BG27_9PROT|nr:MULTISPECIES: NADH-quinone oxidoreductase subunit NuoN [Thalassobaculum]SDF10263.1 NADH dehydrogenase subunit N [Thalassobaculum litoreum DSM 18839]
MDAATTLPIMAPASAEIFLAIAGLALLMVGVFKGESSLKMLSWATIAALAVAAVLVVVKGGEALAFQGLFVTDGFAQYAKILILLGSAFSIVLSLGYLEREQAGRFEYPVLILFATLGMMLMVSAKDLIMLYMGLELQSLALYVVASIRRDTLKSTEAGLKYFVLGALSSGLLLYGCSMIYGFTGTTSFETLATVLGTGAAPSTGLVVGLVFLVCGLAFKVSAVPFHMWTPDVYEGAPTPVTALFAVAPKVAAIALFLRVMVDPFGDLLASWQQVVVFVSLASMVVGALAAIMQSNIKRLMAYSSIGHMGYALVGLAAGTEAGVTGVMIYMATYIFMNVGTFAVILGMRRDGRLVESLSDLAGLSRTHPMMALALMIFMFSMAGIPPLAGFFGKWYVFMAALDAGLYGLAVVGVLASVIGAFYYLRIVKIMYFDEAEQPLDGAVAGDLRLILYGSAVVTVLFFLGLSPIYDTAAAAAASLIGA